MRALRLRLLAVCLAAVPCATPADAQTAAVGPYYATPSWDQTIACASLASCPRFLVLSNMGANAVLDRETGLVWERSPATNLLQLYEAEAICSRRVLGGRQGWRLPRLSELRSLVDPTTTNPALPPGHPFQNVVGDHYWTDTLSLDPNFGEAFYIVNLESAGFLTRGPRSGNVARVWCVRGPL